MISKIIYEMTKYFGQDVRRINHALKVYGFAKTIAGNEDISKRNQLTVELAAVLHDIGIIEAEKKYNSSSGKHQEKEGPPIARKLLQGNDIEESIIDRVCFLIGNHHSYEKIDRVDFQILIEADFLVNIYEGKLDTETIKIIKNKYFKTVSGTEILKNTYDILVIDL